MTLTLLTHDTPRPSWAEFREQFRERWSQGEHVFINGRTGSGKTQLLLELLSMEPYSVLFGTKPRDDTLKNPLTRNWTRVTEWKPRVEHHHMILSAKQGKNAEAFLNNQKKLFPEAMDKIYRQGGWTIGFDETYYMSQYLKIPEKMSLTAYHGRSLGLTGVYLTQRPRWIPIIIPQNAEHAFIGTSTNSEDFDTLAELGFGKSELRIAMQNLGKHDFVYLDTIGRMPIQIVNTRKG